MTAVLSPTVNVRAQVGLVEAGRDVFLSHCAVCHGQNGGGYGRASWVLKQRPPDLTILSNPSTTFPKASVRATVSGRIRLEPSHGASEMPYWRGTLDREIAGSGGATQMDALLAFLEHIQISPYRSTPGLTRDDVIAAGAALFRERCTRCHESGRLRAGEYVLGIEPPDLTTLRERYAGPMDGARIFELIARGHQPQSTDMPSWLESAERAGWPRALAIRDLTALAAFVESIQR